MDIIPVLPHFQASMNTLSTILLITGYVFIKQDNKNAHMKCMISAFITSALFLASYLTYHYFAGTFKFGGEGFVRTLYFGILFVHTILALVALPMILGTFWKAYKENFEGHKKIARWTLPTWIVVSVSGVVVYVMLYHMYPSAS